WTEKTMPPARYREVKYDLLRISYDLETDTWGTPETVLSAAQTGMSILLPRVSPDGRFLLFCMGEYGCFPIYQPTSDLYLMDLQTGTYQKATINSEYADAWHSWSSNSRWIAFSSKRDGGLYTRTFISHIDADGRMGKPFVLPQKSPSFYDSCYYVCTMPELITGPMPVDTKKLVRAIEETSPMQVNSVTGATAKAKSTETYKTGQSSVQ
ncbi:MAG: TolB family protein, partial [Solirubrobacterales bacterium]